MGYLSRGDAESYKSQLIYDLKNIEKGMSMNYDEMDFENADKKKEMEKLITGINSDIEAKIKGLEGLSFED